MNVPDPDKVTVFTNGQKKAVTIVGERQAVKDLSRQVKDVASRLEEVLEQESQEVTKVLELKHFEVSLVRASRLEQQIKRDGVVVELNTESRELIIKVSVFHVSFTT